MHNIFSSIQEKDFYAVIDEKHPILLFYAQINWLANLHQDFKYKPFIAQPDFLTRNWQESGNRFFYKVQHTFLHLPPRAKAQELKHILQSSLSVNDLAKIDNLQAWDTSEYLI